MAEHNQRYKLIDKETILDRETSESLSIIPNIIILGAQKSATTSLANYLDRHHEIFMTKPLKETGYFLPMDMIGKSLTNQGFPAKTKEECIEKYALDNYNGEQFILDASTYYTLTPSAKRKAAIRNIKEAQDKREIKFIYIMRNPYKRIISNYFHLKRKPENKISFEDFLTRNLNAVVVSSYSSRIKEFQENLDSFDLKLLFFEDLVSKPQNVMDDIYSFLKIEKVVYTEFKKFNIKRETEKGIELKISFSTSKKIRNILEQEKLNLQNSFPMLEIPIGFLEVPAPFNI